MHAKYDGDLVLALPAGMTPGPSVRAKLVGAINGTRKASQLWKRFVESRMKEGGFVPTKGCPQLYFHPRREIWSVVHGDDFLSVAENGPTQCLEQFLRSKFKVKDFEAIGPGAGQELSFLNRTVRFWAAVSFEVQPDPRLVDRTVEGVGLRLADRGGGGAAAWSERL